MRRLFCVIMVLLLWAGLAYAQEAAKDKLVAGVEWNNSRKNIENLNVIHLGLGSFFDASLAMETDDVKVSEYLTLIGYEVSENLVPYVLLGYVHIGMDQSLTGNIAAPFSGSIDLTQNEIREGSFAYGLGARGELTKIKEVSIGYDVRYLMSSLGEDDQRISVLGYELNNSQDLDYTSLDLSLIASKEIQVDDNKYVKAVTPYVGYKLSKVDLNKKNNVTLGSISVGTEANLTGITHSAIVGVSARINDSWSTSFEALINKDIGLAVRATYKF